MGAITPNTAVTQAMLVGGKVSAVSTTQYTLTTNTAGMGTGTVSLNPSGGTYNEGTVVTVTATAGTNSQFDNWSGAASGATNPITLTMNSNKTVTANFSEVMGNTCPPDYLFSNNRGLSGTATGTQLLESDGAIESTQSIASGANITYDSKTQITLKPGFHAVTGSTFRAMIDGCSSNNLTANNPVNRMGTAENVAISLAAETKLATSPFMKIFPNPTFGLFTVDGNFQDATIQIYTASGVLYRALSHQNPPFQIDLSDSPSGLYFIRTASSGHQVLTKRIVKKN